MHIIHRGAVSAGLFFVAACYCSLLHAQEPDNLVRAIAQKMHAYSKEDTKLFVHYDKTVYTNNENVWLNGYLLAAPGFDKHTILTVALIHNSDRTVVLLQHFPMMNGLAPGNFLLPDSLPTGAYSFIAFTNMLAGGKPVAVFNQPVTIRTAIKPGFLATLKMTDSVKSTTDTARALLQLHTNEFRAIAGAAIRFHYTTRNKGIIQGTAVTDRIGEYMLAIPVKDIPARSNTLEVAITWQKEKRYLQLAVPLPPAPPVISFHPEGGALTEGETSLISWETSDSAGSPMSIQALLLDNNIPVDTIQTSGYGLGHFSILPAQGHRYTVRLLNTSFAGTEYALAPVMIQGAHLRLLNTLAQDTLRLQIKKYTSQKLMVIVHNYRELFSQFSIETNVAREYKVVLANIPRGPAMISVLDSSGMLLLEQMFFAHYHLSGKINIRLDSTGFTTRQPVTGLISINDAEGRPVKALLSVACMQDNRIQLRNVRTINTYAYLQNELGHLPFKWQPLAYGPENATYLQDILRSHTWEHFRWTDLIKNTATDTAIITIPSIRASLQKGEKRPAKPVPVIILAGSGLTSIQSDSSGRFTLDEAAILVKGRGKAYAFVEGKSQADYRFIWEDDYQKIARQLAANVQFDNDIKSSSMQDTRFTVLKDGEGARLPEVIVTAGKQDTFISNAKNECGDYVCMYGILNCPNHPFGGRLPVKGENYRLPGGGSLVYLGCAEKSRREFMTPLPVISEPLPFTISDYSASTQTAPDYLSTIYWNPLLPADGRFSFTTSDITGKFRIMVQGITENNEPLYGEYIFEVRPRQ